MSPSFKFLKKRLHSVNYFLCAFVYVLNNINYIHLFERQHLYHPPFLPSSMDSVFFCLFLQDRIWGVALKQSFIVQMHPGNGLYRTIVLLSHIEPAVEVTQEVLFDLSCSLVILVSLSRFSSDIKF